MISYYWQVVIAIGTLSIITRILPFLFARFMTDTFTEIGKLLPSYIMLLLVIYEINLSTVTRPPYAIPAILSLSLVTAVHVRFRNTLVSLFSGTALYIFLMNVWL
ncbi:MAG: AzlD domain-containing protein [Legionella sp.]|nr:AzlD domain-containing protein [Legionella sp.]